MSRTEIENAVREAAASTEMTGADGKAMETSAPEGIAGNAAAAKKSQQNSGSDKLSSAQQNPGSSKLSPAQQNPGSSKLSPAQQKARRRRQNALVRNLIQLFFFLMMPGAFVAGFSGVKSIMQKVAAGNVLELDSFVKALIGLCLFTIIFGRFFCGFACAFGTFGDFVYWISGLIQKKLLHRKKQFSLPERFSPWLQKIKFVILAAIVITCALGIYDRFNQYNWNPWSVFSFITALRFELSGYVIGIVILILIIAGMAVKERFFCQFLCPMGAVFAIIPQFPFAWLQRDADNCLKNCRACQMKCPVDIKLETDGFRNGECIGCEKCAGVCPRGNLTRWDRRILKNEILSVVIRAMILFLLGTYLGLCRFL